MIGTKSYFVNAFFALLVMACMYGVYLGVKELKIEARAATVVALSTFAIAGIITYGYRYNDKMRKDIDSKASKDELNTLKETVIKRIDDHREDDKQKYDTLNGVVNETNGFVKEILKHILKEKSDEGK
jgi:hypothetical protein